MARPAVKLRRARKTYHAGDAERAVRRDLSVALDRYQGAAAVMIVLPYSRRTQAIVDSGRKETLMGTNESKTVHRVGCRLDVEP
jgi:hypothetical protein